MPQDAGTEQDIELNPRERSTLRAIAHGGAEITRSSEPDLFVDGLPCCDQTTTRRLAHLDLVRPTREGRPGERVPAMLTEQGRKALDREPALSG